MKYLLIIILFLVVKIKQNQYQLSLAQVVGDMQVT